MADVGHFGFQFGGFIEEAILLLHSNCCLADSTIDMKSRNAMYTQTLPEEERNNFQITTNFPVIFGVFQEMKKNFHCTVVS